MQFAIVVNITVCFSSTSFPQFYVPTVNKYRYRNYSLSEQTDLIFSFANADAGVWQRII